MYVCGLILRLLIQSILRSVSRTFAHSGFFCGFFKMKPNTGKPAEIPDEDEVRCSLPFEIPHWSYNRLFFMWALQWHLILSCGPEGVEYVVNEKDSFRLYKHDQICIVRDNTYSVKNLSATKVADVAFNISSAFSSVMQ